MARPKPRTALRRGGPRREPYDRVLIVCEGSKTEPNYFGEFIAHYQLSSANVEIFGDGGSAPQSVVEYAIKLFEADPDYDSVFCVIDRDGHAHFDQAIQRVRDKVLTRRNGKRKIGIARFEAIASIPCFEYWILLHFDEATAPMPRFAQVLPRLRVVAALQDYDKGARGLFELTRDRLAQALERADRVNQAARDADTDNPTTQVPALIRYLQELAAKKKPKEAVSE